MSHCSEINPNCLQRGNVFPESKCPALEKKIPCWELNWKTELQAMSDEEREYWTHYLKNTCHECPVYKLYKDVINDILSII